MYIIIGVGSGEQGSNFKIFVCYKNQNLTDTYQISMMRSYQQQNLEKKHNSICQKYIKIL